MWIDPVAKLSHIVGLAEWVEQRLASETQMNAERLLRLIDQVIELEGRHQVQSDLVALGEVLGRLASQPQSTGIQTEMSGNLDRLDQSITAMYSDLSPIQISAILSLGGAQFYNPNLFENIQLQIVNNPLSPAVSKTHVDKQVTRRQAFLDAFEQTKSGLEYLRFKAETLSAGEAEVGFGIPRVLFSGKLPALLQELHNLNRVVKLFQESSGDSNEDVDLNTISASDPIIVLGAGIFTIRLLARTITWVLNTYTSILQIKKMKNEAADDLGFDEVQLAVFEEAIAEKIDAGIEARLTEIFGDGEIGGRTAELRNGMAWAHQYLLAQIERGMKIEVSFVAPPTGTEETPEQREAFDDLGGIVDSLEFPTVSGAPVTQIPPPLSDGEPDGEMDDAGVEESPNHEIQAPEPND